MDRRVVPVNFSDRTRVYFALRGAGRVEPHSVTPDQAASIDLAHCAPVHQSVAYPHRRNYDGTWWFATTHTSVTFESLTERDFLLWADWDPQVVSVYAQPFGFQWPKGTPGHKVHTPDYAVVLHDRSIRVVDVRPADRVSAHAAEQFDMARAVCAQIGWAYEVWHGFPDGMEGPLRWLAGFRKDRYRPQPPAQDAILQAFATPTPLAVGLAAARFGSDRIPEAELRGNVYHLLWTHQLKCDLARPLSNNTEVTAA